MWTAGRRHVEAKRKLIALLVEERQAVTTIIVGLDSNRPHQSDVEATANPSAFATSQEVSEVSVLST